MSFLPLESDTEEMENDANVSIVNYLNQRQGVSISYMNQGKYTARLVGQFMLSFWLPQ